MTRQLNRLTNQRLEELRLNHARHFRTARAIGRTVFEGETVINSILDRAGI